MLAVHGAGAQATHVTRREPTGRALACGLLERWLWRVEVGLW
ncbi:hypothetical protein [Gemmatimonas sp.]